MSPSIVFLCMGGAGHVQVLMPVIEGLCMRGCSVRVMTRADFRADVEAAGACFFDLFAEHPLEAADATSIPVPSRFVSFAAVYAATLAREISPWAPDLIVYDTYTVVAPVIARLLQVPYVNVCPNHAPVPSRVVAALAEDPRVAISAECWAAVERLQREYGLADASPFSYVQALSPYLNVYCEPPEFLAEEDRAVFEPIEFFGSLSRARPPQQPPVEGFPRPSRGIKVYISFGTGIWRYFAPAARAALTVISGTLAGGDADALISLGSPGLEAAARAELEHPNVRVVDYADQRAVLEEADVFITHHGINSTHESIFHEVPMISYPFFGDQPALARRCQELGLAVPLTNSPRAKLEPDTLRSAIARVTGEHAGFAARLAEARSWELRTIADRPAVLDRILALGKGRSSS